MASSYTEVLRAHARALGEPKFVTGLPCKYGHLGERYVSTGQCCECTAGWQAAQYAKRKAGKDKSPNPVRGADVKAQTRAEANASGAKKYWPPVPCWREHDTGRYTANGQCVGCVSEANAMRRSKPELVAEAVMPADPTPEPVGVQEARIEPTPLPVELPDPESQTRRWSEQITSKPPLRGRINWTDRQLSFFSIWEMRV